MATWTSDELNTIGTPEELEIASLRRDGTLRNPVTIWVVRHGEELYVRSVNGPVDTQMTRTWSPEPSKAAGDRAFAARVFGRRQLSFPANTTPPPETFRSVLRYVIPPAVSSLGDSDTSFALRVRTAGG